MLSQLKKYILFNCFIENFSTNFNPQIKHLSVSLICKKNNFKLTRIILPNTDGIMRAKTSYHHTIPSPKKES